MADVPVERRKGGAAKEEKESPGEDGVKASGCLLYTSDAADEL